VPSAIVVIAAIEMLLTDLGLDMCGTEHGKQLGEVRFA
jgi:hypothetical protein